MKSTVLLALALFLISAPAPDSSDIAQMTQNFIVPEQLLGLEASEASQGEINAAINSGPAGETSSGPGAGKLTAQGHSEKAAQSVQLIWKKLQNQRHNEG